MEGEDVQRFVEELHKALSTENFAEFGAALHRAEAAPRHSSILHGSLLAMAVSSFETLVAGVATQHYLLHQGAIGTEKEFTLADLQAFASVDDAIDVAIARRVDNLMRGSIDDWSAWFRDLGLPGFEALAADYKRFHETVQRRHLVVHNAGRVSRQYQAKVDDSSTLGEELSIDRDYLERAVDEISVLGNRLLAIAWSKWEPQERSMTADRVKNRSFKLLQDERWLVAEHLAATTAQLAEQDVTRQRAKVNGWIAKLRQQGIDAINDEVVSWDTSALDPIFTVARHALLNEVDELVTVATPLVEDGRLTIRELGTWPLFDLVRGDQRFLALVERAEPDTDQGASGEEQPSGAPGSVDGDRDSPPSHESDPSSQEDQPEK